MSTKEQRDCIFQKLGYVPSVEQAAVHNDESRIRLVAGGERSGKSFSSAMDYMGQFWEVPLLWLVAADYARTGAEYNYICESFDKLGIEYHATKQVDPGEINVMGGFHIVTKSSSDPRKIAMEAPTMIVACEASQLDYETFLRLRGRIAEKRGKLLMSGTFESSLGWYPSMFNQFQSPGLEGRSFSLPTWSNLAIYPGGREDPEIKLLEQQCSKEWFLERYAGIPTPPRGQVFTEFSTLIHTGTGKEFEFNPAEHVYLAVDPGYASAYSVLAIQKRGEYLYVVDEVYERGLITSDIIKVCKQRPWWNKVIGGAIDIAAQAHQAMPAPTEIWVKESGVVLQCQKLQIRDGIEAVKRFLLVNPITNKPLLYVNTKCKGLISEMGGCENPITNLTAIYQWKQDREGNVIGEIPDDKNNHSVKALAYLIVNLFGYSPSKIKGKVRFF